MLILSGVVVVATVGAVTAAISSCSTCEECPFMCDTCSQCIKYHSFCTNVMDSVFDESSSGREEPNIDQSRIDGWCTSDDVRDASRSSDYTCFNDKSMCYGGIIGDLMTAFGQKACGKYDDFSEDEMGDGMSGVRLCSIHQLAKSGGLSGSGSGSGSGILTESCRNEVTDISGTSTECGYGSYVACDTCGYYGYTGEDDCIACDQGYELDVIYSDCTGKCILSTDYNPVFHRSLRDALTSGFCSFPDDAKCVEYEMLAVSSG
jgi:hypothetical protein